MKTTSERYNTFLTFYALLWLPSSFYLWPNLEAYNQILILVSLYQAFFVTSFIAICSIIFLGMFATMLRQKGQIGKLERLLETFRTRTAILFCFISFFQLALGIYLLLENVDFASVR